MTKPELGVKRDCPECGSRFYDLNKEPAHCPKCSHEFIPEALLKPRKPRREDEVPEKEEAPKPAAETSLEAADKEAKAAKSKKKPTLDEVGAEVDDEDELGDIVDIDVDLEDDGDDDTLLEDDEEDDDVTNIVSGGEGDE